MAEPCRSKNNERTPRPNGDFPRRPRATEGDKPRQRPLDAVDGRHCGVEHACHAESVHRSVVLDVWPNGVSPRRWPNAWAGLVAATCTCPRVPTVLALQSNGRGRRPEVSEHLPCIAQDFNALEPLGARSRNGLFQVAMGGCLEPKPRHNAARPPFALQHPRGGAMSWNATFGPKHPRPTPSPRQINARIVKKEAGC